jgi:hypothetical protein
MNDNAWEELVNRIDEMYEIDDSTRVVEKLEDNPKFSRTIQRIEFEKDNTKYRIENIESPKINDKKTFYHHRGAANRVEYEYDPEETSKKVIFYKMLPDGHYNEISPEDMMS